MTTEIHRHKHTFRRQCGGTSHPYEEKKTIEVASLLGPQVFVLAYGVRLEHPLVEWALSSIGRAAALTQ